MCLNHLAPKSNQVALDVACLQQAFSVLPQN
jgi:hypothetical protein